MMASILRSTLRKSLKKEQERHTSLFLLRSGVTHFLQLPPPLCSFRNVSLQTALVSEYQSDLDLVQRLLFQLLLPYCPLQCPSLFVRVCVCSMTCQLDVCETLLELCNWQQRQFMPKYLVQLVQCTDMNTWVTSEDIALKPFLETHSIHKIVFWLQKKGKWVRANSFLSSCTTNAPLNLHCVT